MINADELLLGKGPAQFDERTIKYKNVRLSYKILAPAPATFDAQAQEGVVDTYVFLNNVYGDCVLAAGYHLLLVFNKQECGQLLIPTDAEIKKTYFLLTGGTDSGLNMLDFLNYFRQTGIPIQGKNYTIYAFVSIDWKNHAEVTDAVYYLKNTFVGVQLPLSAKGQFTSGQPWTVTTGPDAKPGSWGGHGIYNPAYLPIVAINEIGPVFMTWGKRQQASWPWCDTYIDEDYGIVPAQNIPGSSIDPVLLANILQEITGEVPPAGLGNIVISSNPPKAIIGVDGITRGVAPQTVSLNAGVHNFTASLTGYTTASYNITINAGGNYEVTIPLKKNRKCGVLSILGEKRLALKEVS